MRSILIAVLNRVFARYRRGSGSGRGGVYACVRGRRGGGKRASERSGGTEGEGEGGTGLS